MESWEVFFKAEEWKVVRLDPCSIKHIPQNLLMRFA